MHLSLQGKVALITGGSRGIGAAAVEMFVGAGARVVFNYRAAEAQAKAIVEKLGPANCAAIRCDLAGTETARELVDATVACFGRIDALVVNHGVWPPADVPIERMTSAQWRETLTVNLDSAFALVKSAVAHMKRQPKASARGHIVLVSSTAGQRGEAFHCDYAATKGAVISMLGPTVDINLGALTIV
jgi:3-oxoacyl-[acyl-carrier protein] reductase